VPLLYWGATLHLCRCRTGSPTFALVCRPRSRFNIQTAGVVDVQVVRVAWLPSFSTGRWVEAALAMRPLPMLPSKRRCVRFADGAIRCRGNGFKVSLAE